MKTIKKTKLIMSRDELILYELITSLNHHLFMVNKSIINNDINTTIQQCMFLAEKSLEIYHVLLDKKHSEVIIGFQKEHMLRFKTLLESLKEGIDRGIKNEA